MKPPYKRHKLMSHDVQETLNPAFRPERSRRTIRKRKPRRPDVGRDPTPPPPTAFDIPKEAS